MRLLLTQTFDGVDIATRDAVLTSTTTTANAALPKAGGTMTGTLNIFSSSSDGLVIRTTSNAEPFIALQRNGGNNGVAVLRSIDGGDLRIDTGATGSAQTTKMTIEAGGNVGIGEPSPQTSLHLSKATTGPIIRLENSTNGLGANVLLGGIEWFNSDASGEGPNVVSAIESRTDTSYGNDGYLTFSTYDSTESDVEGQRASEKMRISSMGNVGIGRADPTQLLEVHKAAGGDQTVAKFSAHNYGDTGKTFIEIGTEYGDGSSRIGSFNDTGNKSVLVFDTHDATSGAFAERMRIDSSGNITNTGPDNSFVTTGYASNFAKLDVRGNGILNSKHFLISYGAGHDEANEFALKNGLGPLAFYTATIKRMTIDSLGNVGIGTSSPDALLDLEKAASGTSFISHLQVGQTGTVANSKYGIDFKNTTHGWNQGRISLERQGSASNFDMVLSSAGAGSLVEGIRIDHTGNVGIGTTDPDGFKTKITSAAKGLFVQSGSGGYTSFGFSGDAGTTKGSITSTSGRLYFGSENTGGTGSNGEFLVTPGTGNVMTLHGPTGHVGIGLGATTPSARLHVLGSSTTEGSIVIFDNAGSPNVNTGNDILFKYSDDNTQVDGNEVSIGGITAKATYASGAYSPIAAAIRVVPSAPWTSTSNPTYWAFSTTPAAATVMEERMRIDAAGNVGIGEIVPQTKLHVKSGDSGGTVYNGRI